MFYTVLKKRRQQRNMTQADLAALTGLPQSYISKIETGNIDIGLSNFVEIARSLDLEPMLIPFSKITLINAIINSEEQSSTLNKPAFAIEEDSNES